MSNDHHALMQEALRELRRARARIAELEARDAGDGAAARRTAAIVGLGCRLPAGIEDPAALWRFLVRGGDAIGPAPADRWLPDAMPEPVPPGAFLADPFGFDAQLFRTAPREARLVDPQQRLVLEVAHATLEHAGLAPSSLRGSDTGVYVGISTDDWAMHLANHLPLDDVEGASGPGTNACAAAGRVSFTFGLHGPSLAVNTACSSSLVALHLALRALRAGECELALVLGTNVMLSPFTTLAFQRGGMLSADGHCRTFAASASGYGRGEGACGVLLATPAAAARLGLRVHALLLGSAVNQDGATAGLTVPSGPAQQRVLRAALRDAGVRPADVQYVEAHGTGTLLGDPIEVQALAAVLGEDRAPDAPLHLASVKTNFGHLEAAAGLLGVLKTVLQLEHRTLVPHLHLDERNPHLPWHELPLVVPAEPQSWPGGARALAGVSSFSFTGTNAHAVLAAAPAPDAALAAADAPWPRVVVLSARSDAALRAGCARLAAFLREHPATPLRDVAATAALGRTAMRVRAAVLADALPASCERLDAVARGETVAGVWTGTVPPGGAEDHAAALDADAPAEAVAAAFVRGVDVPFAALFPQPWQRLALPAYAFQRRHYAVPPRPRRPAADEHTPPAPAVGTDLRARVHAAAPDARAALLARHVQERCAAVLRLDADEIAPDEPLADLGFDSLRAAELAGALERDLGVPLPFADLVDGASAADVGAAIARRWHAAATAATNPADGAAAPRAAARRGPEARGDG